MDQKVYGFFTQLDPNLAEDIRKPNLRAEESVGTVFWLRTSENRIQNNLCLSSNVVTRSRLDNIWIWWHIN